MFSDVDACFSVDPAALCQQIEDWCQLLFHPFTLESQKQGQSFVVISVLLSKKKKNLNICFRDKTTNHRI